MERQKADQVHPYNPLIYFDPKGLNTVSITSPLLYGNAGVDTTPRFRQFDEICYKPLLPSINMGADMWNHPRFQGGLQAFTGLAEASAGGLATLSTGGVGAVVGWPVFVHGADQFFTGMRTVFTGRYNTTVTEHMLQKAGMPPEWASFTNDMLTIGGTMGGSAISRKTSQVSKTISPSLNSPKHISKAIYEKNAKHIFRNAPGHLADTPFNRKLLIQTARNSKNYLGTDQFGNVWHVKLQSDGSQIWTISRNGLIRNGGVNKQLKISSLKNGLSKENL